MTTDREFLAPAQKRVMGVTPLKDFGKDFAFFRPPADLPEDDEDVLAEFRRRREAETRRIMAEQFPPGVGGEPPSFDAFAAAGQLFKTFSQTFARSTQELLGFESGEGLFGDVPKTRVTGTSRPGAVAGELVAGFSTLGATSAAEKGGTPLDLALLPLVSAGIPSAVGRGVVRAALPGTAGRIVAAERVERAARIKPWKAAYEGDLVATKGLTTAEAGEVGKLAEAMANQVEQATGLRAEEWWRRAGFSRGERTALPVRGGAPEPPAPPTGGPPPIGASPGPGEDAVAKLTRFIHSPESLDLSELTIEMRKRQLASRVGQLQARTEKLLSEGRGFEDAMRQAQTETMTGAFTRPLASQVMADEFRDAAFARVYDVLKGEGLERMATAEALTNALQGKGIPRIVGTAGGSAYTRLSRVFPPEVMDILSQRRRLEDLFEQRLLSSLKKFPEGPYKELLFPRPELAAEQLGLGMSPRLGPLEATPRLSSEELLRQRQLLEGHLMGQAPPPRGVSGPMAFPELGALTGEQQLPLLPRSPVSRLAQTNPAELSFWEMEEMRRGFPAGGMPLAKGVEGAALPLSLPGLSEVQVKQFAMMPQEHTKLLMGALREAGMTAIDAGNFLRANMASFDFSWWRQQAPLILNNKRDFMAANVTAWKATWNKGFALAAEQRIKDSRYYQLYAEAGYDFLRPLKHRGVPAWQREEQFMVLGGDRPIPKFTEKLPWVRLSQRAFVTGTNEMNWRMFTRHVDSMYRINEKIGLGEIVGKRAANWNMKRSIDSYAAMISDMTGRAGLGPLKELSPALNAGFFSIRQNLGRLLTPRHLFAADPYTRKEAWKNILTFVGGIAGVEILGQQLGLWRVENDPRNSDFAKIRVGDKRFDPWGGYQQYVTLIARLSTGEGISAETGQKFETTPIQTLGRFVQGKGSPAVGFLMDFWTGKTFTGEKTEAGSGKQWARRIAPFTVMSAYEAAVEDGVSGVFMVLPPSIVGVGVSQFEYKIAELFKAWSDDFAPYHAIPTSTAEAQAKGMGTRALYRQQHPDLDAKLFVTGLVGAPASRKALDMALKLMRDNKLSFEDVRRGDAPKYESVPAMETRVFLQTALGEPLPKLDDPDQQAQQDTILRLQQINYWDIYKRDPKYTLDPQIMEDYEAWRDAKRNGTQEAWLRAHPNPKIAPYMKMLDKREQNFKNSLRREDSALDWAISRFYGGDPVLPQNQARKALEEGYAQQFTAIGISSEVQGVLLARGITTIQQVAAMSEAQLEALPGIGPKTARDILSRAKAAAEALEKLRRAA